MKRGIIHFGIALFVFFLFTGVASAHSQSTSQKIGVDIGFPDCNTKIPQVAFGIVGVTDGIGYSASPCIAQEASHFKYLSLYVNTGWYNKSTHINPTSPKKCAKGDNNCLAYNYGYNGGLYAWQAAKSVGVSSPIWWLDVETSNTWNTNVVQNRNSLKGEYDALHADGVAVSGVYSTTAQWQTITGGWQNGWPSWGATIVTTAKEAHTFCTGHEFTGGPTYLIQYLPGNSKLDHDVTC